MLKNLLARLAVVSALLLCAVPALAATDHAVVVSMGPGGSMGTFNAAVFYMDGSTVTEVSITDDLTVGTSTTQQQLLDKVSTFVESYATLQGYSIGSNVIYPFTSTSDISAAVAAATSTLTPVDYYNNGSKLTAAKVLAYSTTTTSGSAVVYLTSNGLSGGTALCPNSINHVNLIANDSGNTLGLGWALTNSNKTLTITANVRSFTSTTVLGISVLGSSSLAAAANGTSIGVLVYCN